MPERVDKWFGVCRKCGVGVAREGRARWLIDRICARILEWPSPGFEHYRCCTGRVRVIKDQVAAEVAYRVFGPDALRCMP